MKHTFFCLTLVFFIFFCSNNQPIGEEKLNFLGRAVPDSIPQIFWKDTVSIKGRFEMGITISPDSKSIAFGVAHESNPEETCIYLMSFKEGKWTSPDKNFLSNNANTFFPMFHPSGKQLYFAKSKVEHETDLWIADFLNNKANNLQPLNSVVNSNYREAGHGISKKGNFYFTSNRDQQNPCCGDIYRLNPKPNMSIQKVEELSSKSDEESLFLSPNEDYIIIQAWKPEFESKHDLYISYLTKAGIWTTPQRLNTHINSQEIEQRPFVSADNQLLFFSLMSTFLENGKTVYDSDIYWVSTKAIFKPYVYNPSIVANLKYNEAFQLDLPDDLFKDVDDEQLTFQLTLEDGSEIPTWITFDARQLSLSGKWLTKDTINLKLYATDNLGNVGEFVFKLQDANERK